MTETVIEKKVFKIPYAHWHRRSIEKHKSRPSVPEQLGEILPGVMDDIEKRMERQSFHSFILSLFFARLCFHVCCNRLFTDYTVRSRNGKYQKAKRNC